MHHAEHPVVDSTIISCLAFYPETYYYVLGLVTLEITYKQNICYQSVDKCKFSRYFKAFSTGISRKVFDV